MKFSCLPPQVTEVPADFHPQPPPPAAFCLPLAAAQLQLYTTSRLWQGDSVARVQCTVSLSSGAAQLQHEQSQAAVQAALAAAATGVLQTYSTQWEA